LRNSIVRMLTRKRRLVWSWAPSINASEHYFQFR
jgi:hypothetical protein